MEGAAAAEIVVAGLPPDLVAALRARLAGASVHEAAGEAELRERVGLAPELLVLGGWALGTDPVAAVRGWHAGGTLGATKLVCCLSAATEPTVPSRLVGELGVSRLLFVPLAEEELLRHVAELAGAAVTPAAETSRESRIAAGLAEVWARFREPTLRRIDVMEEAALALLDGALPEPLRAAAQREAHKLAGTAGTFGFPRGTRIARQIEERLSLGGLQPGDAVSLSEQLVALRAEMEGEPRAAGPHPAGAAASVAGERLLVLVGADGALAERVESEGAARGLRVVAVAEPAAARVRIAGATPAVVVVIVESDAAAAPSLDLVAELAQMEPAVPAIVLAPRAAGDVRVEAARRGARRFLELPAGPAAIVSHALALASRDDAPPRRILVVDDDPRILAAVRTVLGWSAREVHTLDDPLRFWSALDEARPELLVLDVDMPHVTGLELARAVRSDPRWAHLPIVFLTARTDADTIRRAYAAGADDHIGKPLVAEELITRVRNRLERAPSRDDGGTAWDADADTGVGSRRRTTDLLTRYLHLARRRGDPVAVATIALDDVAAIARTHGAGATELAWRAAAQHLARSLRGEDVVGRWSADELVVVLYGATKADAAQRVRRLLATLARREVTPQGGAPFRFACTAGVAQHPDDGQDVEALHAAASRARRERATAGETPVALAGRGAAPVGDHVVDVAIVDDDEALVGLLAHALETAGRSVHVYRDGDSAAELLADPPPVAARVILLDVDLPALNGLDLLRRLHRAGVTARSRVVMLTAHAGEQDVLTALSLGAVDHVTKPFSVAVLLQKVSAILAEAG